MAGFNTLGGASRAIVKKRVRLACAPPPPIAARALSLARSDGLLIAAGRAARCRFGRSGRRVRKREGDGASPCGVFALRRIFFRPDRVPRPVSGLPAIAITPRLGWCDDPKSPVYNQLIRLPSPWRHETMWRDDHLYDLCIEIGYNDAPARRGAGSAIFLHLENPQGGPTQGCIAISRRDMARLLPRLGPASRIRIG
ncbi:MAG: L,D-transpeptidase family protein [Rhodobiaceae bacterium]|nr:L,D-transpeptidase family protein [Rhodobiaceae bacterium]